MGAAPTPPECIRPMDRKRVDEDTIDDDDKDGMRIGDSKWWPPGFRFHPTDEELILYYLKRKICRRKIKLPMIGDVDVYKWEPWELPEKSVLRSGDKQWYYFSPRDRKYPNGSRSNRASQFGYWKATGKDRSISHNSKTVGNKKTLVYYHGRAPKGQRTDWVMHEYTLDEHVLMNSNNVQDSYALYKLFRKSGPGPKNGEQYGAPFKEEEWDAEDAADDESLKKQADCKGPATEFLHGDSVARGVDGGKNTLPNYDLEDFLLKISSELDVAQQHSECPAYQPEVNAESVVGSDMVGPSSYIDASFTQETVTWCEQDRGDRSFKIETSATAAYVYPTEMPEVTSLISYSDQGQLGADEEFLEMKDFSEPDSVAWSMDDISNNNHIPGIDALSDPYEYFDAQMYLAEAMSQIDGTAPNSYLDGFGNDETQSQASHVTTELWSHDQAFNVSTAVELNQFVMTSSASSGVMFASGSSSDFGGGNNQGQNAGHFESPSDSWFSSALSAFLDSVPSSPAIASENALISKALERVASFRAGQIRGADNPNAASSGNDAAVRRRRAGHNGGVLFISFLVGLGAILWVLTIGATVKVIRSLWARFIPS